MSLYLLRRIYLSNPVVSRPRQLSCVTQHSLRLSIYYWNRFSHVSVHYHVVLFSMFALCVASIPTDVLDYLSFHPIPSHPMKIDSQEVQQTGEEAVTIRRFCRIFPKNIVSFKAHVFLLPLRNIARECCAELLHCIGCRYRRIN